MRPKHRFAKSDDAQASHAAEERAFKTRLANGDASAYKELLDSYWSPLLAYALRIVGAADLAEDAVQNAFIRLWQRRGMIPSTRHLTSYLYRMVRSAAYDTFRTASREEQARQTQPRGPPPATPFDDTEQRELEAIAYAAIEQLPERRREVFILAHFHGLSHRQIAETLGLRMQTVSNHMNLALGDLRAVLQPYVDQTLSAKH